MKSKITVSILLMLFITSVSSVWYASSYMFGMTDSDIDYLTKNEWIFTLFKIAQFTLMVSMFLLPTAIKRFLDMFPNETQEKK